MKSGRGVTYILIFYGSSPVTTYYLSEGRQFIVQELLASEGLAYPTTLVTSLVCLLKLARLENRALNVKG